MIRKLTREEIIDTYNQHLVTDFPEDEVKPLAIILDFYDHHRYAMDYFKKIKCLLMPILRTLRLKISTPTC